jgi:hypothetical protein
MAHQGDTADLHSRAPETRGGTLQTGRVLVGMVAAVGLVTALLLPEQAIAHTSPLPTAIPPNPTAVVTAFVQQRVAPVVVVEGTLAVANCRVLGLGDIHARSGDLIATLVQQAASCREAGVEFSSMMPPTLDALPALYMSRLLEDLAIFSDHLAGLMQDAAAAGSLTPSQEATDGAAYGPRMRDAVAILRRAEGWLETIDHENGAYVRLPGFEGGSSLEAQLNMKGI